MSTPPRFIRTGTFLLNLRGSDKLPLQPNRRPYLTFGGLPEEELWAAFYQNVRSLVAAEFDRVLADRGLCPSAEDIWSLILLHDISIDEMAPESAYSRLPLPVALPTGEHAWVSLRGLHEAGIGLVAIPQQEPGARGGAEASAALLRRTSVRFTSERSLFECFEQVLAACTVLEVVDHEVRYRTEPTDSPYRRIGENWHVSRPRRFQVYAPALRDLFFVDNPLGTVNVSHPAGRILARQADQRLGSWFEDGLRELTSLVQNPDFGSRKSDRWTAFTCSKAESLSRLLERVELSRVPAEARPPYRVLYPRLGEEVEITVEWVREQAGLARERLAQIRREEE